VVLDREPLPMTARGAVAHDEVLLAEVHDAEPVPLGREQHRERGVLLRLDGLDRVHDHAEQPPGFPHQVAPSFSACKFAVWPKRATLPYLGSTLGPPVAAAPNGAGARVIPSMEGVRPIC